MANRKYSQDTRNKAIELLQQGLSSVKISKLIKVPPSTICTWKYESSTPEVIRSSSSTLNNFIIKSYLEGKSLVDIQAVTGVPRKDISKRLKFLGIVINNYGHRIKTVKSNPFEDLDSPEVNYWLGLLAADGNVLDSGNIRLDSIDLDILQEFSKFTGCKNPKPSQGNLWHCSFMNTEIADFLTTLGITPRKSLTLEMFIELTRDFVRGYFDGNGCIVRSGKTSAAVQIATGSKAFALQLQAFFYLYGINWKVSETFPKYIYKGERRVSQAHYRGYVSSRPEAEKIYDLFYYKANVPRLVRKHARFAKILGKDMI